MNQQHSRQSEEQRLAMREQFRIALESNEQPHIEVYLSTISQEQREAFLSELLKLEIAARGQQQETIIASDYLRRFPEYEQCVLSVLEQMDQFQIPDTDHIQQDASTILPAQKIVRSDEEQQPEVLGDFKLLKVLGRGGMGVVYQAHQTSLNRTVALKLIRAGELADSQEIDRFKIEARAAALLQHSGIVSIFETGEINGRHYIAMAYVAGQSLAERISERPFAPDEAAVVALPITQAVAYAHEHGVIHRDLKPANVLIDQQGQPQLTDFGLAKQMESESSLTASGDVLGTPSYMPPEQAAGQTHLVTVSADIYSVGAILYAMLCGRPPFHADKSYITLMQVITQEPVTPRQLNPAIPVDLETICLKCLEKDPSRRYGSAHALAEELQRFLAGEPILARPVSSLARFWRWCKRKPLVAALSAAVVASLLLGISFSIYFRVIAEQRAERAEEGTRIALTTLESVINTVQEKLRYIPEARAIRKELLRNTMADLEKLSGEVKSQARVDLNTANVLVDLGLLFQEVGDDAGMNATSAAEENYKNAVVIFSQLAQLNNTGQSANKQFLRDHARALERLGNLYIDSQRVALAEGPLQLALKIRRQIVTFYPDDLLQQGHLSDSILYWGDVFTARRDFEQAVIIYTESETIAQSLVDAKPDDIKYARLLSTIKEKLGDTYHDLGQNYKAYDLYTERLNSQQALCDKLPENLDLQYDLSFAYERLGNHWLKVGDAKQAKEMYLQMHSLTEKALTGDPNNLELQDGLMVCYEKLQRVYSRLNQQSEAQEVAQKAATLRAKLNRAQ